MQVISISQMDTGLTGIYSIQIETISIVTRMKDMQRKFATLYGIVTLEAEKCKQI